MFNPSIDYFFNTQPPEFAIFGVIFLGTAFFAIILGVTLSFYVKRIPVFYRKIARKTRGALFWYGWISLGLYFLRLERIPYLSMRLWLWIWFFGFFAFFFLTFYREYRKIPVRKEKWEEDLKLKRYAG